MYQGAVLAGYNSTTLKACTDSALADVKRLEMEMKARLEWSNLELLRATIVFPGHQELEGEGKKQETQVRYKLLWNA